MFTYDPDKNAANIKKHGIGFDAMEWLDWGTAFTSPDTRYDYGESRNITYAMLQGRLHCLIWTVRGNELRIISLRKANSRERNHYEKENPSR